MGIIKDPKKAIYNKVYNKATIDIRELSKISTSKSLNKSKSYSESSNLVYYGEEVRVMK